jgi:signal transduction histidine kinase
VIKDHNGFINVTSKIGYGATFTIYLPVSRLDAQGKHSDGPVLINLTS